MRKFVFFKNMNLFMKLSLVFLVIVISFYYMSIQIHISGTNRMQQEIINSDKAKIDFFLSMLEEEFLDINRMQISLVNNEDIKNLINKNQVLENTQKVQALLNVQNKMTEIKNNSTYAESCKVYLLSEKRKVADNSISYIDAEDELFLNKLNENYTDGYPCWFYDGRLYIAMPHKNTVLNFNHSTPPQILYWVVSEVNTALLEKSLKDYLLYDAKSTTCLFDKNGAIITSSNDNKINETSFLFWKEQQANQTKESVKNIDVDHVTYISFYRQSPSLHLTCFLFIPEDRAFSSISDYSHWIWIISIITLLLMQAFTLIIRSWVSQPLKKLVDSLRKFENGTSHELLVDYDRDDEFRYIYSRFNAMIMRMRSLLEQVYEEKLHSQNAELKQLQYQISPHFLYNTIFVLYQLIKMRDDDNALKLTDHMGKYYQYITKGILDDVPLSAEIAHVRSYTEIQSIRFSNRLTVTFEDIPKEFENLMVPKLILQPIIENSFSHGLEKKARNGTLHFHSYVQDNFLVIVVQDNGTSIAPDRLEHLNQQLSTTDNHIENSGLINVHKRIRMKFGNESGVFISPAKPEGTRIELRFKINRHDIQASMVS